MRAARASSDRSARSRKVTPRAGVAGSQQPGSQAPAEFKTVSAHVARSAVESGVFKFIGLDDPEDAEIVIDEDWDDASQPDSCSEPAKPKQSRPAAAAPPAAPPVPLAPLPRSPRPAANKQPVADSTLERMQRPSEGSPPLPPGAPPLKGRHRTRSSPPKPGAPGRQSPRVLSSDHNVRKLPPVEPTRSVMNWGPPADHYRKVDRPARDAWHIPEPKSARRNPWDEAWDSTSKPRASRELSAKPALDMYRQPCFPLQRARGARSLGPGQTRFGSPPKRERLPPLEPIQQARAMGH